MDRVRALTAARVQEVSPPGDNLWYCWYTNWTGVSRVPVRFGIVGFHHSHVHAMIKGAREIPGIELAAIADHDPETLRHQADTLKVPAYADYREMLRRERLDAVGIAEIYHLRPSVAAACLRAGIAVTGDKPLCLSSRDVEELAEAQRAGGAPLHMLLSKRFSPQIWHLKELIDKGRLGQIVSVYSSGPHPLLHRTARPDWFFRRQSYGGILTDLAVHDLDLVAWLSGSRITSVQGVTGLSRFTQYPEFEDHGDAVARTAGGTAGLVHVDWLTPEGAPYWGDYRVYVTGTLGTAEAHWAPDSSLTVCTVDQPPYKAELSPAPEVFADFVLALTQGAPSTIRTQEVLSASAAAAAAQESARSGSVAVPVL